jgi:HTH-type transcriptional regulator/antitoxin HipB
MPTPPQPIVTPTQLGIVLQGMRKSRKLSQAQLAARLGLSQNRLSELERNPGTLSVEQLLALCAQLGLQLTVQARDGTDASPAPPATDW